MHHGKTKVKTSIDQCTVPYFGHSCKIYPKQICFSFINKHVVCITGYLYKFDVYCGKSLNGNDDELGTSVNNTNTHKVYFYNFFSSHDLITKE